MNLDLHLSKTDAHGQNHDSAARTRATIALFLSGMSYVPAREGNRPDASQLETAAFKAITNGMKYGSAAYSNDKTSELPSTSTEHDAERLTAAVHVYVPTAAGLAAYSYPKLPFGAQLYITIYTALILFIECDDHNQTTLYELENFGLIACSTTKYFTNPALVYYSRLLSEETSKHWGPYASGTIFRASLDFLLGVFLETKYPKGLPTVPTGTCAQFPFFQRYKTGVGDAFTMFCFLEAMFPEQKYLGRYIQVVPEMMNVVNISNDVLSFYKEHVVGDEENTLIFNRARTQRADPFQILEEQAEQVVACKNSVRRALDEEKSLWEMCELFIQGYIAWHCDMKRYRLDELLGDHC
jgi:intracellular sulfur oxidation DsrE/DsrF family protein